MDFGLDRLLDGFQPHMRENRPVSALAASYLRHWYQYQGRHPDARERRRTIQSLRSIERRILNHKRSA